MEKQVPVELYFVLQTVRSLLDDLIHDPDAPEEVLDEAEGVFQESLIHLFRKVDAASTSGEVLEAAVEYLKKFNSENS